MEKIGQINLSTAGLEVRSDDKSGRLARETTILDGGFRSLSDHDRTNRLFNVSANRVTIRGLILRNAMARGAGAGANITGSAFTLADCTLTNLHGRIATADGGALAYSATSGMGHVITNCLVTKCGANAYGGALFAATTLSSYAAPQKDYLLIFNSTFANNTSDKWSIDAPSHSTRGLLSAPVYAINCVFRDSSAALFGDRANYSILRECTLEKVVGGLSYPVNVVRVYDSRFDKCAGSLNPNLLERCTITGHVDQNGANTTVSCGTLRNCLYTNNNFPLAVGASVIVDNCTIVSNNTGGILLGPAGGGGKFVNCVVFGNKFKNYGSPGGYRNFCYRSQWAGSASSSLVISNCYIEGAASYSVSGYKGQYVDPATGTWVTGDGSAKSLLSFDPSGTSSNITAAADAAKARVFVDWTNGDWRLPRKSPLRDAGLLRSWMVEGATDMDGNPRLTDRFGNPFASDALPDIGCYECQIRTPRGTTFMVQ